MTDLCIFAHFDPQDRLAEYVLYYLKAIQRAGFSIVVVSTSKICEAEVGRLRAIASEVILRKNVGLDFGSWAEGLNLFRDGSGRLRLDGRLLLTNDSVYGPIGNLAAALERLLALPGDVRGMVESEEIDRHLQSWFLLFEPPAYNHPAFQAVFAQDFGGMSKSEVVRRGELGLSAALREASFRFVALSLQPPLGGSARLFPSNPTHFLWRSLIECDGVPFIKVELLRDNPCSLRSVSQWQRVVEARAPELLPLILADLATKSKVDKSASKGNDVEDVVLRDDYFARRGYRIFGQTNHRLFKLKRMVLRGTRSWMKRIRSLVGENSQKAM